MFQILRTCDAGAIDILGWMCDRSARPDHPHATDYGNAMAVKINVQRNRCGIAVTYVVCCLNAVRHFYRAGLITDTIVG